MSLLASIFREEPSEYVYSLSKSAFLRILALAAANGVVVWALAVAFDKLMLTPVFCSEATNIAMCANSTSYSSYIALLVVGILMVPLLIMFGVKRPLVVVVAATVVLWGVTLWANGPWTVSILWTIGVTVLTYLAIIWINRIRGDIAAILLIVLFVILARVVLLV